MGKYNSHYSQSFDALPVANTDIWKSGAYYFPGWTIQRTVADSLIEANTGSGNTGGLFSYGSAASKDRALGSISSLKKGEFAYGLLLVNNTETTIQALDVSYIGEQWRISNSTAGEHRITFWYAISGDRTSFNLSPASDKGWTQVPNLTFSSPFYYTTGKALDGNAAANRRYVSQTISVNIPAGHFIMLRWKDSDELEADHGLAIDDVSLTWRVEANTVSTPLPVELIKFIAKVADREVILQWQTAMEEGNDYFVIERSFDGRHFEGIGMEKGNGTTTQRSKYAYTDENPLTGTSYYRLKQVDEDGSYSYSPVISIMRQRAREDVVVFPTTTSDTIHIECETGTELKQASVFDVMGKKVFEVSLPVLKQKHLLNVASLGSSMYVLVLQDANGRTFTRRIRKI